MPNFSNPNLVLKIISIGLSHDISYLEEVKYSTDGETILTNRGKVSREEEFIFVHRRMHLALITLGCLILHYPLARLCFHVASVCEPDSDYCKTLLENLPECDYNDYDTTFMDPVLINIRYLLEAFHYDIKGNTRLTTTFQKVSNNSFSKLEYFNHRVTLSEDLKPLEYPGVEKYLRKQNTEDTTHVSQVSDLEKCIKENAEFNVILSGGLKNILNKFVKRSFHYPSQKEVFQAAKDAFLYTENVKFTTADELYTDLMSLSVQEILANDFKHIEEYKEKRQEENSANLFFDFKLDDECGDANNMESAHLDEMYKSGVIKVLKLYRKGFCTIDIENILLFAIFEKKMKFLSEEFAYLNKNRNVELDVQQQQQNHNQIHAGFLYITNRRHPEYCRLSRLTSSLKKYYHAIEYYLDSYTFDGSPGKYKFILKYKTYKTKTDIPGVGENAIEPADIKHEPKEPNEQQPQPKRSALKAKVKKENVEHAPLPSQAPPKRVLKNPSVIILTVNDRFNLAPEVRDFFVVLQSKMSEFCGRDIKFNMQKLIEPTSPHFVSAVTLEKSYIVVKLQKIRNSRIDPRESEHQIEVPLCTNGKLILTQDFRDEIEYDEFNDNPRIKSTSIVKVSGNLVIEKLTHNVRFEIDCVVDGHVSKLKFGFQGSRARPKKKPTPVIASDPPPPPFNNPQPSHVLPHFSMQQPLPPPPPSTYANVVPNNDNYLNYNAAIKQESILPPFGSIVPSTSNFITQQQQQPTQYTQPPVFCQSASSQEMTYSSSSSAYNNGNVMLQDSIVKEEYVMEPPHLPPQQQVPQILQPPPVVPLVKPKVEIQKVEIISPVKLITPNMNSDTKNNTQSKKISFSANPAKIQAQNGSAAKLLVPKDELVDFEDAIGSVATPSVIPIVVPKFEIQNSIQRISNAFQNEANNEQNCRPSAAKVSVIKTLPMPTPEAIPKHFDDIQKSPPPLHHYAKDNNCENNFKSEMRTPTKAEQKFLNPTFENSVIVKNGTKPKLEEELPDTIDLTDDTYEEIDLTVNYSIRRELGRKTQKQSVDFAFVACAEEPIRCDREIIFNGSKPPIKYKSAKRPSTPTGLETKDCKIRLVDVMENLKHECTLKKNTLVKLIPVRLSSPDKVKIF